MGGQVLIFPVLIESITFRLNKVSGAGFLEKKNFCRENNPRQPSEGLYKNKVLNHPGESMMGSEFSPIFVETVTPKRRTELFSSLLPGVSIKETQDASSEKIFKGNILL